MDVLSGHQRWFRTVLPPDTLLVVTREVLVGILIGLSTSMISWIGIQICLRPRLRFGQGVSAFASDHQASGFWYRIKLQNSSWLRSIVDLQLNAYVRVYGLDPQRPKKWTRIPLNMSVEGVPNLAPGENRVAALSTDDLTAATVARLKDYGFKDLADNPKRSLRDLMELGADNDEKHKTQLIVQALGSDGWSGSEYFVASPSYHIGDIKSRNFVNKPTLVGRWRKGMRTSARKAIEAYKTCRRSRDLTFETSAGSD